MKNVGAAEMKKVNSKTVVSAATLIILRNHELISLNVL